MAGGESKAATESGDCSVTHQGGNVARRSSPLWALRQPAPGQLHVAAGTQARVLRVPGREEVHTRLPATARCLCRSRSFAPGTPGTDTGQFGGSIRSRATPAHRGL